MTPDQKNRFENAVDLLVAKAFVYGLSIGFVAGTITGAAAFFLGMWSVQ